MQQMRHEDAERGKGDPCDGEQTGDPGQHDDTGNDGRRSQHDADLEGGGSEFVMMIFCFREIALFLGVLGAFGQLLLPFAGFRLRYTASTNLVLFPYSASKSSVGFAAFT